MSARKAFTAGILLVTSTWAAAATVHVANNGVDSAPCGSFAAPCRSITRGVANARAGDTVLVQPGRYGDLDRDGVLAGPGEEVPAGTGALRIAKPVKVLSTNGAATTVIDGGGATTATVEIASSNVTFGDVDEGFTVVGAQAYGLFTDGFTGIRISGNVVTGAPSEGFFVISAGLIELSDNVAHHNPSRGIQAVSRIETGHVLVRRNKVYSNGVGISVAFLGSHEVSFNEISNNLGAGMTVDHRPTLVFRNLVTGNGMGILAASFTPESPPLTGPLFLRNTLVGNLDAGIQLSPVPANARVTLRENNVYGNGLRGGFFANCGIANVSNAPVNAANTYWGAATGPGADPADVPCGHDPVVTTPFARGPN